jgi:hypothetical protein
MYFLAVWSDERACWEQPTVFNMLDDEAAYDYGEAYRAAQNLSAKDGRVLLTCIDGTARNPIATAMWVFIDGEQQ